MNRLVHMDARGTKSFVPQPGTEGNHFYFQAQRILPPASADLRQRSWPISALRRRSGALSTASPTSTNAAIEPVPALRRRRRYQDVAGIGALPVGDGRQIEPGGPGGDLVGRNADLADVVGRLIEVALQVGRALLEPADVVDDGPQLALDDAGLLDQADVAQHRADRVQGRPQGRRRDDPDLAAEGVLDDVAEAGVQLGVDRFRRQEHQRRVRRSRRR